MLTRRQWQKIFRNPFIILVVLTIFFFMGQFIIRSVNRSEENPIKSRIWQTVQAMNRAWTIDNNPAALKNYFHPNMVVFSPGDSLRISGQSACLAGWTSFAGQTHILSWKEFDPQVQVYGRNRFAIVTYYWEIEYESKGQTIHSTGRDMLSLVREHGRWWIAANPFSPYLKNN